MADALERLRAEVEKRRLLEADRVGLMQRIVSTQEEERRRIARELHDNLGQQLTGVMLGLQALETQVEALSGGRRHGDISQINTLRRLVDGLMRTAHRQAWELRPAELDAMGLDAALHQYISDWNQRTRVPAELQTVGWPKQRVDTTIETTLYRVVQEALTNVTRHAQATEVSVVLELNEDNVCVIIEDNGRGFNAENTNGRLGILGMRERLAIVGGTLEIESSPGQGTTIFARAPL